MSVHVIELGRREQQISCETKLIAKSCKNCGAPMRSNKCEYCGTEHIADIVVRNELSEMKEKHMRLEMKKRTK